MSMMERFKVSAENVAAIINSDDFVHLSLQELGEALAYNSTERYLKQCRKLEKIPSALDAREGLMAFVLECYEEIKPMAQILIPPSTRIPENVLIAESYELALRYFISINTS